jgi:hypothetical protein
MARDDAATTFLFGPSTTLLLGVYIQKNESWHLWCDVALVWFFRFCCISTGKAADLSTGYPLFRGFLLRAGCMGVRCAGSGRRRNGMWPGRMLRTGPVLRYAPIRLPGLRSSSVSRRAATACRCSSDMCG